MEPKSFFVCKVCRWWWHGAAKAACPQCGGEQVDAKKLRRTYRPEKK